MRERISREELVQIYHIEISFFDALDDAGLLTTETENDTKYVVYDDLPDLERWIYWHYDLEVNLAGLEVIQYLTQKIRILEDEKRLFKIIHK